MAARMAQPSVSLAVVVPLRTGTGLNAREHWAARSRRVRSERDLVAFHLRYYAGACPPLVRAASAVRVRLVRLGGRRCDGDNLAGGLKAVRDEVARWLGKDDGDPSVSWSYSAEPGGPWGVRVEVTTGEELSR